MKIIEIFNVLLAIMLGIMQIVAGDLFLGICILCWAIKIYVQSIQIAELEGRK